MIIGLNSHFTMLQTVKKRDKYINNRPFTTQDFCQRSQNRNDKRPKAQKIAQFFVHGRVWAISDAAPCHFRVGGLSCASSRLIDDLHNATVCLHASSLNLLCFRRSWDRERWMRYSHGQNICQTCFEFRFENPLQTTLFAHGETDSKLRLIKRLLCDTVFLERFMQMELALRECCYKLFWFVFVFKNNKMKALSKYKWFLCE